MQYIHYRYSIYYCTESTYSVHIQFYDYLRHTYCKIKKILNCRILECMKRTFLHNGTKGFCFFAYVNCMMRIHHVIELTRTRSSTHTHQQSSKPESTVYCSRGYTYNNIKLSAITMTPVSYISYVS